MNICMSHCMYGCVCLFCVSVYAHAGDGTWNDKMGYWWCSCDYDNADDKIGDWWCSRDYDNADADDKIGDWWCNCDFYDDADDKSKGDEDKDVEEEADNDYESKEGEDEESDWPTAMRRRELGTAAAAAIECGQQAGKRMNSDLDVEN